MNLAAVVREAARSLGANTLRTALTMLGMVIGVAAVVLMLAVGSGAQNQVNRAVSSMGSNLLVILSGSTSTGTLRMGSGNAPDPIMLLRACAVDAYDQIVEPRLSELDRLLDCHV